MPQPTLRANIIEQSEAKTWYEACQEWRLQNIWMSDDPQTCQCGHFPIHEICVIRNRHNGNLTDVGNCCVNNFLGINSEKLFASVRKVSQDVSASFNAETINLVYEEGYINDWELSFYLNNWRKRKLSYKAAAIKQKINEKILRRMRR
ncbi:MAG: hypothetical protein ACO1RA_21160 [Planctomycetaceae bacterium]